MTKKSKTAERHLLSDHVFAYREPSTVFSRFGNWIFSPAIACARYGDEEKDLWLSIIGVKCDSATDVNKDIRVWYQKAGPLIKREEVLSNTIARNFNV